MIAPSGAVAWTSEDGWLYRDDPVPVALEDRDVVLVVSDDGELRGVSPHDRAPLAAVLRVDADLVDVVTRLGEISAELGVLERQVAARLTAVVHRVDVLEDGVAGQDTGNAVEIAALRTRVRRLEEATR